MNVEKTIDEGFGIYCYCCEENERCAWNKLTHDRSVEMRGMSGTWGGDCDQDGVGERERIARLTR